MKSFVKIVLLLIVPLNVFSQEIMQRPDARDIFSDKTINEQYEPVKLVFDFSKKDVLSYDYSASGLIRCHYRAGPDNLYRKGIAGSSPAMTQQVQ